MSEDAKIARITRLLEALIAVQKVGIRQIERQLRLGRGSLRRILNGQVDLKFRHVIAILEAIGVPEEAFFKLAYEHEDAAHLGIEELTRLIRTSALAAPSPLPPLLTHEEVDTRIIETLMRFGLLPQEEPTSGRKKSRGSPRR